MTNTEIIYKGQEYVMNTYGRFPIVPVKGQGSYVWDADGKQYLDFLGGIAVCVLGHCDEEMQAALQAQAARLWHISNLYWIKPQVELAEKLVILSGMGKAFFCNSGAEANEAAIKLARKYFYRKGQAGKNQIIVFKDSFHGRTLATVTATGQSKYQEGFAPLPQGFVYADYNDLGSVEKLVSAETAAIMLEPIQGEGGIHPATAAFIEGIRHICDQRDILLIFDEVQSGIGRTGTFFAYQSYGVKPDIVTMAKGLGGGFPIGAMLATNEAATGFAPGDHASTFGGNPLATAAANQLIATITKPEFIENTRTMGLYLREGLNKLADTRIIETRGIGLMLGTEFDAEVKELVQICLQKGLLLIGAGPRVVRFVPPLNINRAEVDQALSIFSEALHEWK
ncbi:MAG: aspartate aminotransferase family protein [Syntrophomonadaceae bacterium]|nr:aspartate aminotransferase family protein [Syntrophomonadaceae bacterium]